MFSVHLYLFASINAFINRRRGLGGARTARFPTFLTERKGGTGSDDSLPRSVAGSTLLPRPWSNAAE